MQMQDYHDDHQQSIIIIGIFGTISISIRISILGVINISVINVSSIASGASGDEDLLMIRIGISSILSLLSKFCFVFLGGCVYLGNNSFRLISIMFLLLFFFNFSTWFILVIITVFLICLLSFNFLIFCFSISSFLYLLIGSCSCGLACAR